MAFHINDATTEAGAVWKRKGDEDRFLTAREGDMWCAPFQCDWCWFSNLQNRCALSESASDQKLLHYIRRVNLDIMWSREPATIRSNLTQIRKLRDIPPTLGLAMFHIPRGPWPVGDACGFRLAITMLKASQGKGKHTPTYVQFETVRKMRSALSNAHESSALVLQNTGTLKGDKGRPYRVTTSGSDSYLFGRFVLGLENRMGRLVKSNIGLDISILLVILKQYNKELSDTKIAWHRKREIIMSGSYFVLCYGASLRGNEGLYLEGSSLVEMIRMGQKNHSGNGHVCAPLLGRFKTEMGENKHVAVIVNITASGLNVRLWLERLVWLLRKEGKEREAGPAFCNPDGSMIRSYELNGELHSALHQVQISRPDLIPKGTDIEGNYGTFRSFRRGSLSRATEAGIKGPDLDLINRWRKFEYSAGSRPHMSMKEHYLEIKLVLGRMLNYSKAL